VTFWHKNDPFPDENGVGRDFIQGIVVVLHKTEDSFNGEKK
jgi:hypothetical protein